MITLRLFHENDLQSQLDAYLLGEADVTIGRDAPATWVIADPERQLSRLHCTMSACAGRVRVRDSSANGVFLGPDRARVAPEVDTDVARGETIRIGRFVIVVDDESFRVHEDEDLVSGNPAAAPLSDAALWSGKRAMPDDWPGPSPTADAGPASMGGGIDPTMLEAFCAGARLDASYFASEDPAELMQRVGEIYQQVVLGLGDLMGDRASLKSVYSMESTTISATANNPMKWAPTQRLAIDLISNRHNGFMTGAEAVKECFEDLKGHSQCLVAGSRAAVSSVLEHLDPGSVEADVKARPTIFMDRSEACWRSIKERYSHYQGLACSDPESTVNAAFKLGYEHRARELAAKKSD